MKRLFFTAPAVFAAACAAVGPDYRAPVVTTPPAYAEAASRGDAADLGAWWTRFEDPTLTRLVERALTQNLDLEQARARITEARAQEAVAGAGSAPRVSAQAQASENRISENAIPIPPGAGGGQTPFGLPGARFEEYRLGFDASWEIDLFGGVRRGVEAAKARTRAQAWSARDLDVSLAGETASAYLALRALQARARIAADEVDRQRGLLAIAQARAVAGFTSRFEVDQQRALMDRTAAAIPPLRGQARAQIHALGVLVGEAPERLIAELIPDARQPAAAPLPPLGLPSDLLRWRPDIRAAERRLAAASADIGVATAKLYPRFSLTAQPTLVSTSLSNLVTWGSRNLTAGVGLDWPILDGGRTRAEIRVAGARQGEALAAYRQSVLVALRDVEDALSRADAENARHSDLARSAQAAVAAVAVANDRYRAGLANYGPVLTAQAAVVEARDALAQSAEASAQDAVALFKALGGGWTDADLKETPR